MWMDQSSTSSAMMKALFVLVATRQCDADTRALRKRPLPWRTARRDLPQALCRRTHTLQSGLVSAALFVMNKQRLIFMKI